MQMPYNVFKMYASVPGEDHLFKWSHEMWKLKVEREKALSLQGRWHFWLCCLLCVWPQPGPWICTSSFLPYAKLDCQSSSPSKQPLKKGGNISFPIDKPGIAYKKARGNMSLCIWIWFIGQLLQINSLSRPDCFTAMSYSLEWQSPLMQMEGDSHPENPLLDVAGQNDGGHSKCYYTGPTQYQGKAPHCVFIHNLDCRLMVDALLLNAGKEIIRHAWRFL